MYASQTNTPQLVKYDTDIFTTMSHEYLNQQATHISDTDLDLLTRRSQAWE